MAEGRTRVLIPVAETRSGVLSPAPRPRPRGGLRVALVENTKPNADRILTIIGEMLRQRVPGLQIDRHVKHSAAVPYHELASLRTGYDLVVEALGD